MTAIPFKLYILLNFNKTMYNYNWMKTNERKSSKWFRIWNSWELQNSRFVVFERSRISVFFCSDFILIRTPLSLPSKYQVDLITDKCSFFANTHLHTHTQSLKHFQTNTFTHSLNNTLSHMDFRKLIHIFLCIMVCSWCNAKLIVSWCNNSDQHFFI